MLCGIVRPHSDTKQEGESKIDIKATLQDLGIRKTPIFSGIRPTIQVKEDYLSSALIEFESEMIDGYVENANIMFVSPEYYLNSLWVYSYNLQYCRLFSYQK